MQVTNKEEDKLTATKQLLKRYKACTTLVPKSPNLCCSLYNTLFAPLLETLKAASLNRSIKKKDRLKKDKTQSTQQTGANQPTTKLAVAKEPILMQASLIAPLASNRTRSKPITPSTLPSNPSNAYLRPYKGNSSNIEPLPTQGILSNSQPTSNKLGNRLLEEVQAATNMLLATTNFPPSMQPCYYNSKNKYKRLRSKFKELATTLQRTLLNGFKAANCSMAFSSSLEGNYLQKKLCQEGKWQQYLQFLGSF